MVLKDWWLILSSVKKQMRLFAFILRHYHWFPGEMTSQKRMQKTHTDDVSLPRSRSTSDDFVVPYVKFTSTYQKHYPDLGSDASSVWNFCTFFSDLISRGNQWWHHKILPVLWGQIHAGLQKQWKGKVWGNLYAFSGIYICILNCFCVPAFNESCVGKQINLQS